MSTGVAAVAQNAIRHFEGNLYPDAVRIFTPFANRLPVGSCDLTDVMAEFLARYEPKVLSDGVFPHQADFFKAYRKGGENFIITTATGSGKSLCFWSWVFDCLGRQPGSTALLCFPTQALMWGQAERLVRLSERRSLAYPGGQSRAYGGAVPIGAETIGWTIWHGKGSGFTYDPVMAGHERSLAFSSARIRIATLDIAHWSLFRSYQSKQFASRLRCLVLDEAHSYDGVFGANVHYFLNRLYLASEILGRNRPGLFLASATLSSAKKFAGALLSLNSEDEIVHIADSTRQIIDVVAKTDVPALLKRPRADGLLRIVMLLDGRQGGKPILPFMGSDRDLGPDVNAIYFSESKFGSKRMRLELGAKQRARTFVTYDADLPPSERRRLEQELNDLSARGMTVLATNALELGVDIEGLDVCFIDQVPPGRANLLQRIGRVGRRVDRPGLVFIRLSAEPHDQHLLDNPRAAFQLDLNQPRPIPMHLDILRWKHALAAFSEWMYPLSNREIESSHLSEVVQRRFGFKTAPTFRGLRDQFGALYGSLVDIQDDRAWVYHGFRASAGKGKIPLMEGDREIARIEDVDVFRDAHPEAIFLGHDLNRYRVVDYRGRWSGDASDQPGTESILGKWLPSLQKVIVERESRLVTTRGSWEEGFNLHQNRTPSHDMDRPRQGKLEFGIWDYTRTWQGYTEIDLKSDKKRLVTVSEVRARFERARGDGAAFAFLHPFSYRTMGWQWDFGRFPPVSNDPEATRSLGSLAGSILEHFAADAVESKVEDIGVQLDLHEHQLRILDTTPGGNGLSEALLTEARIRSAFQNCIRTLTRFTGSRRTKAYNTYVLDLCHQKPGHPAEEVAHVLRELHARWMG
jgi:superfamily II DNA/RNA helicase